MNIEFDKKKNMQLYNQPLIQSRLKHTLLLVGMLGFLISCGTSKPVTTKKNIPSKTVTKTAGLRDLDSNYSGKNTNNINSILKDAEKYIGTPYKYGGNTSSGFDCSGFTVKVFSENDLQLPRRSVDQSTTGKKIDVRSAKPGDLLFFATSGGSKVSHVGIVHDIGSDGEIKFIHASTSKGVTISSLNEKYWNKAFLHAQRVL